MHACIPLRGKKRMIMRFAHAWSPFDILFFFKCSFCKEGLKLPCKRFALACMLFPFACLWMTIIITIKRFFFCACMHAHSAWLFPMFPSRVCPLKNQEDFNRKDTLKKKRAAAHTALFKKRKDNKKIWPVRAAFTPTGWKKPCLLLFLRSKNKRRRDTKIVSFRDTMVSRLQKRSLKRKVRAAYNQAHTFLFKLRFCKRLHACAKKGYQDCFPLGNHGNLKG